MTNIDPNLMPNEGYISYIEHKIRTSCLPEEQRAELEMEIAVCNLDRAVQILEYLEENQLDPISQRGTYSQKDIHKKLDKLK